MENREKFNYFLFFLFHSYSQKINFKHLININDWIILFFRLIFSYDNENAYLLILNN